MQEDSDNTPHNSMSLPFVSAWLLALMIIGGYLRIHGANEYYYNQDEMMHLAIAKASSLKKLWVFSHYENHPPLGHIIRHYWMMLGDSPEFMRSLALIFGLVLIPLYYFIGVSLRDHGTGIICAIFMTFSQGCIIQSYLVRNYTMFLFFLSLSVYSYLHWRKSHTKTTLSAYTLFGALACLTHFSSLLAITAIALYEQISLWRDKTSFRRQGAWALANMGIATVTFIAYTYCAESIHAYTPVKFPFFMAFLLTLVYPVGITFYLFSGAISIAAIVSLLSLTYVDKKDKTLRAFIMIFLMSLAIGMGLFVIQIYPFMNHRQNLWILPFMLPLVCVVISNGCDKVISLYPNIHYQMLLFLIVAVSAIDYYSTARFADGREYTLTFTEESELENRLAALDSTSLIVAERPDAFLLNPPGIELYNHLKSDYGAQIVPYNHTRLLYKTTYMPYDVAYFVARIKAADERHELDGVDRFVLLRSSVANSAIKRLMLCKSLDKNIETIPPHTSFLVNENKDEKKAALTLTIISRAAFFSELVAPDGKAHSCLED